MTPDHRPYLRPGVDLCTADEVRGWLLQEADGAPMRRRTTAPAALYAALASLTARLDRERRQACRRGALHEITLARAFRCADGDLADTPRAVLDMLERWHTDRAIAFRAAARAR